MRTYLYVDGENFAIRAKKLVEGHRKSGVELSGDVARLQQSFGGDFDPHASRTTWIPEPHRDAKMDRTRFPKTSELRFACDRFIAYDQVLSVRPLPNSQ